MPLTEAAKYLIPIIIGGVLIFGAASRLNFGDLDIVQRGDIPIEEGERVTGEEFRERVAPLEEKVVEEQKALMESTTTEEDVEQEAEEAPEMEFSNQHKEFSVSTPNDPFITRVIVDPYKPELGEKMTVVVETRSAFDVKKVEALPRPHEASNQNGVLENTYDLESVGFRDFGETQVWKIDWEVEGNYENGYVLGVSAETERNTTSINLVMP